VALDRFAYRASTDPPAMTERARPWPLDRFASLAMTGILGGSRRKELQPMPQPIDYENASPAVRAVFDDIKATRKVEDVNNFWKYLANDPATLARTWANVKDVMAPGALDPLVKEMIYVAVSATNGCGYCIASHSAAARKAGMSEAMFSELMAVVGLANLTNRLANGYRVPIDPAFER
jgi:AhpD family alkylhydroperoxidase